MIDPAKVQFHTGFNTYKNLQVHPGSITVDGSLVIPGGSKTWSSTITVEPNSKFVSAMIQNNRDNYPSGVTALKWASFPSANTVWQTLSLDPDGRITHSMGIYMTINGAQVTFSASTFNNAASDLAFDPVIIDFVYAVHTLVK